MKPDDRVTFEGTEMSVQELCDKHGITFKTAYNRRVGRSWSTIEACTKPMISGKRGPKLKFGRGR